MSQPLALEHRPAASRNPDAAAPPRAAFEAHRFGQTGGRRGLRGGEAVLQAARSAYLAAEWSGPADRRPAPGRALAVEA